MDSKKNVGKAAKNKPKRSPKKAAMKNTADLRDVRENRNETSDALAYFANYYDQI